VTAQATRYAALSIAFAKALALAVWANTLSAARTLLEAGLAGIDHDLE